VRDNLTALGLEPLIDSAALAVTELVTNACLHARTPIIVSLRVMADDTLRIEVTDESPRAPELRRYGALATTGRGLRLLESLGRWGIDVADPPKVGKTVWFEPSEATKDEAAWEAGPLPLELDQWPDLI
jgi:hypothetical protein